MRNIQILRICVMLIDIITVLRYNNSRQAQESLGALRKHDSTKCRITRHCYYRTNVLFCQEVLQKRGEKIQVCQECHKAFCPAACPNSEPDNSLRCALCGEVLEENNYFFDDCSNLYCPECINEADVRDILWICGCRNVANLLTRYGALKKYGDASENSSEFSVKKLSNKCSI